jgi:transmembrane sensor
MEENYLTVLFEKYVRNECTEEERARLMDLILDPANETTVKRLIDDYIQRSGSDLELDPVVADNILQRIFSQEDQGPIMVPIPKTRSIKRWWMAAAAVLILVLGALSWLKWGNANATSDNQEMAAVDKTPVLPGGNHAVLAMSDGTSIVLGEDKEARISKGHVELEQKDGMLIYRVAEQKPNTPILKNTLTTPSGGQFKVLLPDGTQVWLNARSSLHFPSEFTGNTREVSIEGEAYFEVAANKKKPFQVKTGDLVIRVLGTHFNVNAYRDDNCVRTSLLEGSVQLVTSSGSTYLKPGQQGVLSGEEGKMNVRSADMDQVVAWKNGLFNFSGTDFSSIMQQIGRWYNVDVVFEGPVPQRSFEGKISRSAQLFEILQILELQNLKFELIGRKLIVKK